MMYVYILDKNDFLMDNRKLTENDDKDTLNYTTKQMTVGYYKPRFNHSIQDWEEGATPEEIEEIKRQQESNRPPQQQNEIELLLLNGYDGNLYIEKKDNVVFISGKLSLNNNIVSNIIGNIPSNMYPCRDIELNGITINTNGQIINTGLGIINGYYII